MTSLLDSFNAGHADSLVTIHAISAGPAFPSFPNLVMYDGDQTTFCHTEAEIGEEINIAAMSLSLPFGVRVTSGLDISAPMPLLSSRAIVSRTHPVEHTHLERDWAWVLHELTRREWYGGSVAKEPCSRGGAHSFCISIEGVILHSISWWCKNGASHRKNFDTPPLIGNCPDTLGSRQIPMKTHDLELEPYLDRYRL
jgi:hypothetical protein